MKKNNGFTLIELLAVIVILAIIALISSPIIIKLIDNARKETFKDSAYGIVKAGELFYSQDLLKGTNEEVTFTYTNGVESSNVSGKTLNYKGSKPTNGEVQVNIEGEVAIAIHNGTYCAEKKYEDTEVALIEKAAGDCTIIDIGKPTPPPGELANVLNDVDSDGYLDIWYLEQLSYIRTNGTTLSQNYELMRDLNFQKDSHYLNSATNKPLWTTGSGWQPIGGIYVAKFDGKNHTISNLYINRSGTNNVGLFTEVDNNWGLSRSIGNLRLVNVNITGYDYTGGIVGYGGNVYNSYVQGSVRGHDSVGLLAGQLGYVSIEANYNCYTEGTVQGNNYVGGLAGRYGGYAAKNLYSSATVTGVNYVGGLIGDSFADISNAYSIGSVTGTTNVGGLIGRLSSDVISNGYWNTETSGVATSAAGTGLTTAQMKQRSSYSGWNYIDEWGIRPDINNGYPCFQSNFDFKKEASLIYLYNEGDNAASWVEGYSQKYSVQTFEMTKNSNHLYSNIVGAVYNAPNWNRNEGTWVTNNPVNLTNYNSLNYRLYATPTMGIGGGSVVVCISKNKTGSSIDQCEEKQTISYQELGNKVFNISGLNLVGDYYIRFHILGGNYQGNLSTKLELYKVWLE